MRRRRLGPKLGLALLGLAVGLALAELALRLAAPGSPLFGTPQDIPPEAWRGDAELFQVPNPGWSGEVRGLEYRATLRFDEQGLRAGDRSGAPRVLLVGDSFALGAQVEAEQTMAGQLARRTGAAVLNAGVDGYGTEQAARRVARLAPKLAPDRVILLFFLGNDLADNQTFHADGRSWAPVARARPWLDELARRSWLVSMGRARWLATRLAAGESPERDRYRRELEPFSEEGAARLAEQLPHTEAALAHLDRVADAYGAPALVALAPPAFAVEPARARATLALAGLERPSLDAPARAVSAALARIGLPACDLGPALAAAAASQRLYFRLDGHWTPEGHAVAAEAVADCLAAEETR